MESNYNKIFVGGDLSGIQRFLYNITSRKAAVSLKGRSDYLNKYMKGVCKELKRQMCDAGCKNVDEIYCSGGKFYIVADYVNGITDIIDGCTSSMKKKLWEEQLGQLGLGIGYVPFSENPDGSVNVDGRTNERCGELWKIVNAGFVKQKHQRCKEFFASDYEEFFEPIKVGGNVKTCAVTGVESPDCVGIDDDKDKIYVLPSVKEQIECGEKLRKEQGFKTFEQYAEKTKLGILRMDVDGLGKRFITGFKSIEEYKVFSKRLAEFFENGTYKIQKEEEFKPYLNVIYAGGDDLFVVGRWDKVIDFAERIHHDTVKEFGNDGLTISGGIAIVNSKFPISKAAELSGDAEDAAKHWNDGKKNAFCFLGKTVSWEKEFEYVKSYRDRFVELINNKDGEPLSKGILHKIMLYSSIADRNKELRKEGKAEDFSYIWHLSYYMTRYMKMYWGNAEVQKFCKELRDRELIKEGGRSFELIALAARWAELLMKDSSKKENCNN